MLNLRERLRAIRCQLVRARRRLWSTHSSVYIGARCRISNDLIAGEFVYIGCDCEIGPSVEIGAYSMLGPRVVFTGDDHVTDRAGVPTIFSGRPALRPTYIGKDVWIGTNSIVMSGTKIGNGAVVAAGAVVTTDVGECEIHGGVPNRKIRDRFDSMEAKTLHLEMLKSPPAMGVFCGPKIMRRH